MASESVFRWWHRLVSVVLAAGMGLLIELITDAFSWALASFMVVLVVLEVALSVWQRRQDRRDRRAARDEVLGSLRPVVPAVDQSVPPAAIKMVHWLTAPYCPTPLWGRAEPYARLRSWCVDRDPGHGVVRVVAGPAGVGKSRLALAVAESLPAEWAAGWFVTGADGVVERIVAAGEPTLVIVGDADRVSGLDTLIIQAARHPTMVRLLVLLREASVLGSFPDTVRPQVGHIERLAPIGEDADRRRWFEEAVRAYARTLQVPPPPLPRRPVGEDFDTLLALHARALLTVLGHAGSREWSLAEIAAELVAMEQGGWTRDTDGPPAGGDVDAISEAVTVLMMFPAPTLEAAANLLRRVPQFSHESSRASRFALARWARRRYRTGLDNRLDMEPRIVGERLLLDTLNRTRLVRDDDGPEAMPALLRAYQSFPEALDLIVLLVRDRPACLPQVLQTVLASGITGHSLDVALAGLVDSRMTPAHGAELVAPRPLRGFPHLTAALTSLYVDRSRACAENDPQQLPNLGRALDDHTLALREIGQYERALEVARRSVALWRDLDEAGPPRWVRGLAASLSNLGTVLRESARYSDALQPNVESVDRLRRLDQPGDHLLDLAQSLHNLGANLESLGRYDEALEIAREATATLRRLAAADSKHLADFASALQNLGLVLGRLDAFQEARQSIGQAIEIQRRLPDGDEESLAALAASLTLSGGQLQGLGRYTEALLPAREAVEILRRLVDFEPSRHQRDLARALIFLGTNLKRVARPGEGLAVTREAVVVLERLAISAGRAPVLPLLASALNTLGTLHQALGNYDESLKPAERAVAIRRELADADPAGHLPDLAQSLDNLAGTLRGLGRHRESRDMTSQAVVMWRELVDTQPAAHNPSLAQALDNLTIILEETHDPEGSLQAQRDAVDAWKSSAASNWESYGARYRRALGLLRRRFVEMGQIEAALHLAVDNDSPARPPDTRPDDS